MICIKKINTKNKPFKIKSKQKQIILIFSDYFYTLYFICRL